jgi:hypothetical protein
MARKRQIAPGGTRGTVLQEVARIRREDAAVLFGARRYRGAIYLAGYAIECLLKWAVTERCEITYLPAELETHDWDTLLPKSGLRGKLLAERSVQTLYSELADSWGPELRYRAKEPMPGEARVLYEKLNQLYLWIEDHAYEHRN